MGSPIADEHNRKGLGMILSSKFRGESDKLNDGPSKGTNHHHHKPGTDLAATLQTSSTEYPSNEGYSYTEALFTGAPLLNGTPVLESDRTQEREHSHGPYHINKVHDGNKGTGFAKLEADKSNDHNKEEDGVQIQKEVHTEEGVVGNVVKKKSKENQHFQTSLSNEAENGVQSNTENFDENQQSSSNASLSSSKSERLDNAKYTQIHEVSGGSSHVRATPLSGNYEEVNNHYHRQKSAENPLGDRPVEQVHQILVTGKTQENFASNADSGGPFAGQQQVQNKLSDKPNTKSYDEESNLLGPSVYSQGRFVGKQGYHFDGQQHHEFHSNIITGPTEYEKPGNSLHQPSMDELPRGVKSSEKESGTSPAVSTGFKSNEDISKLGNKNIQLQSEFIPTSTAVDAENGKVETSYQQLGQQPLYQNHEQQLESNTEGADVSPGMNNLAAEGDQNSRVPFESRKIPLEKTNEAMTMPLQGSNQNEGDSRVDKFINQLRPHKIIESSFDQELTRKITTGPSHGESNYAAPMQSAKEPSPSIPDKTFSVEKSKENESENTAPPSLPFREGSNPVEFNNRNEELTKDQKEHSIEESVSNPENTNHNEKEIQQDTPQQMLPASAAEATPEHEDTSTDGSISQKEQEETPQSNVENEPDKSSSSSSANSLGQASITNRPTNDISSLRPYGEGSHPTALIHQNKVLPNDRSSDESEAAVGQEGTLDKLPDHESAFANGADSAQTQETPESSIAPGANTNVALSDISVNSQGHTENQREGVKEEQSSLPDREGSNPKMAFGNQNEELQQNVEQNPGETPSISSSEAGGDAGRVVPLRGSQMEATKQENTLNGISSTVSDNGVNLKQEREPISSLQSSTEHQTETNSSSSDTSDQNEQRQQSVEASSPVSASNRVRPLSSSGSDSTSQRESSDQMISSNEADAKHDLDDRFINDAGLHQEKQSAEISPSDAQSRPDTSDKPEESSRNSSGPSVLVNKPHEVKVGTPEEANATPVAKNSKEISEGQQLMPFLGIRNETSGTSEEKQNSQLIKENDHDNRNQKIVYFLKMAKGIPLLNSRKMTHFFKHGIENTPQRGPEVNSWTWQYNWERPSRQRPGGSSQGRRPSYRPTTQPSSYPSPSTGEHGIENTPQRGPEENSWTWQYNWERPSRQRPGGSSQGRRPSYRPTTQPSSYPSPSTGEGGGALGGSSTSSNEPQGKHLPFLSSCLKC